MTKTKMWVPKSWVLVACGLFVGVVGMGFIVLGIMSFNERHADPFSVDIVEPESVDIVEPEPEREILPVEIIGVIEPHFCIAAPGRWLVSTRIRYSKDDRQLGAAYDFNLLANYTGDYVRDVTKIKPTLARQLKWAEKTREKYLIILNRQDKIIQLMEAQQKSANL